MKKESEITKQVVALLVSLGYPNDSIVLEWNISDRTIVDLAIIDPIIKRPIALFEIKKESSENDLNTAKEQIKSYAKAVGIKTMPLFVILSKEQESFFRIFSLIERDGKDFFNPIDELPPFEALRNSSISKKIIQAEKVKRRTFDFFWVICWILSATVIILLICDFKGIVKLTPERLGIIAVISGLIILPFARKLNILGLEFERLQKDASDKKI
jgi:hypothetical protein